MQRDHDDVKMLAYSTILRAITGACSGIPALQTAWKGALGLAVADALAETMNKVGMGMGVPFIRGFRAPEI